MKLPGCAIQRCNDPACGPCTVNERFAITECDVTGARCRYVKGHPGACQSTSRAAKVERADFKASKALPDLSAPGAPAQSLAFKKRHRDGPFRGNA